MNNRKFYSSERNNYYYGKLLTSRDFQTEQRYMNDKRRAGNLLFHGSGIAAGLKVVAADDTAIVLQSGMAIDNGGREIIVPETVVVKLATIEGSQKLRTNEAYLCISYEERMEDKVYAVMKDSLEEEKSGGGEYNHIRESYKLSLADVRDCTPVPGRADSYLVKTVLYEDEDYRVTQEVAEYLPSDRDLRVHLKVYKKRRTADLLSVSYTLGVEGIKEQNIYIRAENLKLDRYEEQVITETVVPKDEIRYLAEFTLRVTDLEVRRDKKSCRVQEIRPITVTTVQKSLRSMVIENSYRAAMDAEIEQNYDTRIYLAKLYLINSEDSCLLERVEEVPFGQYVYSAGQLMLLEELKDYYPAQQEGPKKLQSTGSAALESAAPGESVREQSCVTGVFDLPLGNGGEAGKVSFSDEIMHGLGQGPVYVEAALEMLNRKNNDMKEEILLGDAELFAQGDAEERQMQFSLGVKVLPDRGTFIVAVKPRNKMTRTSVRVRWYAYRAEDTDKNIIREKERQGMLLISPDTITTTPKGIVQIQPQFVNMAEEACSYEVLDQAGGSIDNNGIYTAPTAEGVYEIRVSCIRTPEIFAYAYIIVSAEKKK